jgi:hypothetical protein
MSNYPMELVDSCLYDETTFRPDEERFTRSMFAIPVGQREDWYYDDSLRNTPVKPLKSFLKTNQLIPGMLPVPHVFRVDRLNALFLTEDRRPLRIYETSLYARTLISFSIMQKSYWDSPAWQCASPFALFDTPKDEIVALKAKYGIEWAQIGASFEKHPLLIPMQACFQVRAELMWPLEESVHLAVHLDGELERAAI